ncbi:MAG: hypothetical protein K0R61_4685 [Microvirga sp.]|jgi:hypothetical protein|nr:hypothetical protein [Microvirga sp.]
MQFIFVLIVCLISGSASSQVWDPAYRGSGQRAGGPAYLLNHGGRAPGWGYGPLRVWDSAYRGIGHRAGGPAHLLNPAGYAPLRGYRRGWYGYHLPAYRGSGHRAGGPAYLLNHARYAAPGWGYGPPLY